MALRGIRVNELLRTMTRDKRETIDAGLNPHEGRMNAGGEGEAAMTSGTATRVGIFTLGLAAGALAAPFLPGLGSGADERRQAILLQELEADFGPERVRLALIRAEERLGSDGHY